MLQKFKDEQNMIVKILSNQLKFGKTSHAYLFISNNYSRINEFINAFIIDMIAQTDDIDKEELLHKINNGSFLDLTVIEPDGLFIKKEQIEKLQSEFKNTALEVKKKFYVIKEADKFNKSSANTILKFLEEPEENIVAILIANNDNNLLETITSRCMVLNLNNDESRNQNNKEYISSILFNDKEVILDYINTGKFDLEFEKVIKFINYYEQNGIEVLIHLNDLFHSHFADKNDVIRAFDICILYYSEILKYYTSKELKYFNLYSDKIEKIVKKNNQMKIGNKINILVDTKNKVRENANIKLLIDNLIFELEEV